MKYIKALGLAAVVAIAAMAFAGAASATTLTSPTGTTYTSTITAVQEAKILFEGAWVTIECDSSHLEGKVEQHGAGVTVGGKVSSLTFSGCNYAVTVVKAGSFEIHAAGCSGGYCTGTLTSTGAEFLLHTSVGTCTLTTNNTDVGTVTPSNLTGDEATFDINGKIPRTAGSFLCGSSGTWTAIYEVTKPSMFWIDA